MGDGFPPSDTEIISHESIIKHSNQRNMADAAGDIMSEGESDLYCAGGGGPCIF